MTMTNLSRTELLKKVKVTELMTSNVITIEHDDLVGKASRMMMENRIHSILVMKQGKPVYIISTFDLLKLSYEGTFNEDSYDMLQTTVEELVQGQKLIKINTATTLIEALQIFTDYSIHSIPVIDGEEVKGIITLMDLAIWYRKTHEV
ncbi:MAG: CBS domain-containing protein [Leptospiraceae bacterium]|nr:CBS domain-containing protein [Leptospiraceae bacterium]